MSTTVYYNGEYVSKEALRISPDDRGFLLGDGVYEVARAYGGRLFELQAHLDRLAYSLRETQIRGIDSAGLEGVASELLGRAGLGAGDGIVYVQVTRGSAPRTHYFPPADVSPTVYAYAAPLRAADHSREGIDSITVPDLRWSRCDIKAISLLANCLANQTAHEGGAHEAILVRDGVALEGSHTSFFAVFDGEVRTAPLTNYVLPGITRSAVLMLCAEDQIPARETPLFVEQLDEADELFLAGTTAEVLPVVTIDGHTVADGRPGPTTRRLQDLFRQRVLN